LNEYLGEASVKDILTKLLEQNENSSALDDRVNESFISSASESVGVVAGHNRSTSLDAIEILRNLISPCDELLVEADDLYISADSNMSISDHVVSS